ncbi:geranylgeranyl pyrophosphate synthetase [Pleomassaria siparia CBS 279.74]|uniref:geranylgeranyl diphosphate synthase n=1 Tax=Pleomassaria siparia CBS 279.74 TaxID=1314801 RepID=A0A6G1K0E9_9PLEO|nr:geranylgeranyl pyrophosphate synthetase [Pleomassaria siparia CBS 279.74]
MPSPDVPVFQSSSPFASPNAIPPRTSSHGIISPVKLYTSVLRPLSEVDWMSQSKKSKHSHSSTAPLRDSCSGPMPGSNTQSNTGSMDGTAYLTPASSMSPPPNSDQLKGVGDDLIYHRNRWTGEKEKILMGPFDYLYGHPGKDIRSQLIAAFNAWLRVPPERLEVITRVVGMLHTASLLVDDVEDSSVLRRGIPVANSIFGVAQTINSANYVYFKALQDLAVMGNPKLIEIYTEELLNLHRGQGMDLYWRDSLTCPSEADYLEMVGNKTGGLLRLAIKLMQAESAVNIDCTPLVSTVGLLYQILDDHLNLSPTSGYSTLKGFCEDLTEGKFSFPVIHAIRADPSNLVLMNILKQKTTDEEVKRYAVKYLEEKGSFEYSKTVIVELRRKSEDLVRQVESGLGVEGYEGAQALRVVLERLVLR